MPELGPAVYRLTQPPGEYKHTYHIYCPWSPDDRLLVLARYNRVDPLAEICVMDAASGDVRVVGKTSKWECHNSARQQWLGNSNRIIYPACDLGEASARGATTDSGTRFATVDPDGSNERIITTTAGVSAPSSTPDGRWLLGGTPLSKLFPNDTLAPRHDKGLIRIDTESGEQKLILSIEQALELIPNAKEAADCHLYMKMFVVHPQLNRVLFNLTNTFWDRGNGEPRIRNIISVGLDGSDPTYVGQIIHHPNWHTIENRIIANAHDCNGKLRLVLYPGDGNGFVDYVPLTKGSGHPTFSPDGKWICTDGGGPEGTQVIFCDPISGQATTAMDCHECGGGYVSFNAVDKRPPGVSVMTALERSADAEQTWQTQRHPTWSRDGTAVLVNSDRGDGSHLYVIDVRKTLAV